MKIDNHLASDTPPARILILEDSYIDAAFIKNDLEMSGLRFDLTRAQNRLEFLAALAYSYDLILCDYYLDHFNAEQALAILRERGIDTPVVLITNADEQKVLALVEQGANDFLQKDRLGRLAHSVKRELALHSERRRAARQPQAPQPQSNPAPPLPGILATLTERQVEILILMADNWGTKDIANMLALSEKTVAAHRADIKQRLGVNDQAGLLRLTAALGLKSGFNFRSQ
jgi:DNA-binding NarL/FixJ family response regulator